MNIASSMLCRFSADICQYNKIMIPSPFARLQFHQRHVRRMESIILLL